MYSSDGAQYYQPVTQLTAQGAGQKPTRTDRLEVCFLILIYTLFCSSHPLFLIQF
jgi:hypothetical protein